jgi:hypothetical protein
MNSFSRKMELTLAREETDVRRAQSSTGFAGGRPTIELAHGNATARTNRNSSACRVRSRVGKFYGERHVAREIVYVVCGFRWTDRTDIPPVSDDSITAFASPTIAPARIRRFERSLVQSFEVLRLS